MARQDPYLQIVGTFGMTTLPSQHRTGGKKKEILPSMSKRQEKWTADIKMRNIIQTT